MFSIIFLDLDGVCNSHKWNDVAQSCNIEPRCVEQLNRILHETGARVVLSSAWRYMILGGAMTYRGFEYMLRTHGVTDNLAIIDCTVSDEDLADRSNQIEKWLRDNAELVTNWIVIDDMHLAFTRDQLVRTDEKIGLTEVDADRAIELLGKK